MPPLRDEATSEVPNTPFWLSGDLRKADVIVVGAGFTGLRVATTLKTTRPEWRVVILESLAQGAAASNRNAGFACFGSPGELISDIDEMGMDAAADLLSLRFEGIRSLQTYLDEHGLTSATDGGNEVFEVDRQLDLETIRSRWENLRELWERAGLPADLWVEEDFTGLSSQLLSYGFHTKHEFGIDPQELYDSLERRANLVGVSIYRGVTLEELHAGDNGFHLTTSSGAWKSPCIALCTNAGRTPNFTEGLYPGRGQIVVTEPLKELPFHGNYHMERGYYYFRNVGDRLLIGGGRHLYQEEEMTRDLNPSPRLIEHLKGYVEETLLPGRKVQIEYAWSGTMGFHRLGGKKPLLDRVQKGVYRCVGFGGMGVALSNSAATKLSTMILNDRS